MKIGYFITKFPYSQSYENYAYGGASIAAYHLAIEMAKLGHEIIIFTTSLNSKESIEECKNLKIYRYGTNFKMLTSNISLGLFRKPLRYNVDIIHTHFDIPPGPFAGLTYAKKKDTPFAITYHGDWVDTYGGLSRRIGVTIHNKFFVHNLLSSANVIISPSKYYINNSPYLKRFKDKISVIPNGINLSDFSIPYSSRDCREKLGLPLDKKIILFLGYLAPYKGPDMLIKAMPQIIKRIPNVELIFAGKGVMRENLESLTENLNINKNVKFKGFISDDTKILYYKAADIFCLPSTMSTECYPLTILEAMACGTPIIASNIGGISDAINEGENGLLVEPRNPESLAEAIINLLENEDIRRKMRKNGQKKIKDNSWDCIAKETEKIYNKII